MQANIGQEIPINLNINFSSKLAELNLTCREKEILSHLAWGKTNKEISNVLSLSPSTVRNHISNIFNKLKISNRSQATAIAIYAGLVNYSQSDCLATS